MVKRDTSEKDGGIQSKGHNPIYPIVLDNHFKAPCPKNIDMRVDPYKIKDKYLNWKQKTHSGIPEINSFNSDLIKQYLYDMENGMNVSSATRRGSRSYVRLNVLRQRLTYMTKELEKRNISRLTDITESQLFGFFGDMRNGTITRHDGKLYKSIKDFVKDFKAFWHWHQKINRKKGVEIPDITVDLDTSGEKPVWVYLTEEQIRKMAAVALYKYQALIWFLFDTGIRAPTELMNIKVSDFYNDFKEVQIREETSKTFGRRIKLMICSEVIKEYVLSNHLAKDAYLFTTAPHAVNKYLKRLGRRVCGGEKSPAGAKYSELTMYDFRHCSCCYWLPRYKSESALKYRFGWKKSDKIHYYSELLGMRDTIQEEDLLVDVTRTEIEKELQFTRKKSEIIEDRQKTTDLQLVQIMELVKQLEMLVKSESGGEYRQRG